MFLVLYFIFKMEHIKNDKAPLLPTISDNVKVISCQTYRVSIGKLFFVGLAITPIALMYGIANALFNDFEASTYTHCHVLNVVPSLSAVARCQQYFSIWIAWLQFPQRLLVAWLYYHYYRAKMMRKKRNICYLSIWFLLQDSFSALAFAQWSHIPGDNISHVLTAGSMWIASCLYMLTSFLCYKFYRRGPMEPDELVSLFFKEKLAYTFSASTLIMWIWYFLHNEFCLPFAFSMFSICELVNILCYLMYIWTAYFDFFQVYFCYNSQLGCFISDI